METVFSLASYNATNKVSNAEWESSLSTDVILNDGDTLSVKSVYIDTRTLGSDNIIIEEDTPLSIDYYYYYNNTNAEGMTVKWKPFDWTSTSSTQNDFSAFSSNLITNPDGLPYILAIFWYPYNYNTREYDRTQPKRWTPAVSTWSMLLKKGAYAKDYLAEVLTKNMTSVFPENLDYQIELGAGLQGAYIGDFIASLYHPDNKTITNPRYQATRNFMINPYFTMPDSGTQEMFVTGGDLYGFSADSSNIPSPYSEKIPAVYVSILNKDGVFNLQQGYLPVTQTGININEISTFSAEKTIAIVPYITASDLMQNIALRIPTLFNGGGQYLCASAGASEISLLWNNQNNNIFSWDYIHTPIIIGGKQSVMLGSNPLPTSIYTDQQQYYATTAFCDRQSGIMFAGLYPSTFWNDTLGFQNITYGFNDGNGYQITRDSYRAITTSNYWGLSFLMTTTSFNVSGYVYQFPATIRDELYRNLDGTTDKFVASVKVWESDTTNTLDALSPPVNPNDTGHFLLEIQGYTNSFFDEKNSYQVKSIVSNYYISPNSFATSPFADSFLYIHHGDPMLISQLKVRILSPKTKQPYPLIGPNSTVYLQLGQQITAEKVQQPVQS
jgi:hypothetical protein